MLYFGWVPADPDAVRRLLPRELRARPNRQVFMNQYEVDREEQMSHFGPYTLTYLGPDVRGLDVSEVVPARWWTHYWTSSPAMSEYAAKTGAPVVRAGVPSSNSRMGCSLPQLSTRSEPSFARPLR
jgi:hypothetical protein